MTDGRSENSEGEPETPELKLLFLGQDRVYVYEVLWLFERKFAVFNFEYRIHGVVNDFFKIML